MEQFKTKRAAVDHFRKYLHDSEEWAPLAEPAFSEMVELIGRHPSRDEKIGCGIDCIYVRRNPRYPSQRSFWIRRTDGTETDFSYLRCIDGEDRSSRHWFNVACRHAIKDQIIDFKKIEFLNCDTLQCAITGVPVIWSTCHIDHAEPTFNAIVDMFIVEENVTLCESLYKKHADGECEVLFASGQMAAKWLEFHRRHAVLRVVHSAANLRRKRT